MKQWCLCVATVLLLFFLFFFIFLSFFCFDYSLWDRHPQFTNCFTFLKLVWILHCFISFIESWISFAYFHSKEESQQVVNMNISVLMSINVWMMCGSNRHRYLLKFFRFWRELLSLLYQSWRKVCKNKFIWILR